MNVCEVIGDRHGIITANGVQHDTLSQTWRLRLWGESVSSCARRASV